MGDFSLGCLLGHNMSFETWNNTLPSSWTTTGQSSFYQSTAVDCGTHVHSSDHGISVGVNSGASETSIVKVLSISHGNEQDAYERWFPEVTTHSLIGVAWAKGNSSPDSGQILFGVRGTFSEISIPIPAGNLMTRLEVETVVRSFGGSNYPQTYFKRYTSAMSFSLFKADDVLTMVDPIAIHPEWEFREAANLTKTQHRTQGGKLHTYLWGKHFSYSVPLRFLPSSHADLINWWWQNQFNLAFTLDTSDGESTYICRIVNEKQPIGSRITPYKNMWGGVLNLESINQGGLMF